MSDHEGTSRRELLLRGAMTGGLVLAYGTLAAQGVLFLLPRGRGAPTQKIFVGLLADFAPGEVRTLHDPTGGTILVRRGDAGLQAFSSVCPHLGCQVHWQEDEDRFLCPCHRGLFDAEGVAYAGPPAEANQRLAAVPLEVDAASGTVYMEVPVPEGEVEL